MSKQSCTIQIVLLTAIILGMSTLCRAAEPAIGTNILSLSTGTLNINASLLVSRRVSLHLPFSYNPFTYSNNNKAKHLSVNPGVRLWRWHGHSGLFTGFGVNGGIYNIGIGKYRYSGQFTGASLSCGYAFMISRRFNLEAEVGIGLGRFKYDKYLIERCGEYAGYFLQTLAYPSKASISVIYIIQ